MIQYVARTHDASPARPVPEKDSHVRVLPVTDDDLPDVASFLGEHMPPDSQIDQWAQAWRQSVTTAAAIAPNHGFLLRQGDHIVGVYLAIYSMRTVRGRPERFCSFAHWCVRPEHRLHSLRLIRALLNQPGWHFTDTLPDAAVQRLNQRLGFEYLDTTAALLPNLLWPSWPGRTTISSDPATITAALRGEALRHYLDHAQCRHSIHLVIVRQGRAGHVMIRKERRRGVPIATITHVSDAELLRKAYRPLSRYLLTRYRTVATIIELRLAGRRLQPSILLPGHRPKMYRSTTLAPDEIDYLYSELTCAP